MWFAILSEAMISDRIQALFASSRQQEASTFTDQLKIRYLYKDAQKGVYCLCAQTEPWMCNPDGAVHGGVCAALADQAMGMIAYCLKEDASIAPTIQLQVSYHRPLPPGETVLLQVRPVSVTKRLIHMAAEISHMQEPGHVYFSSTATFFCKDQT